MTARTLPISSRGGLTLVHQPTRSTLRLSAAARLTAHSVLQRLTAWWRRTASVQPHWEEVDRARRAGFPLYPDAYTWLPRPSHTGGRHGW